MEEEDRKEWRRERKARQQRDRSQHKKTDQAKQKREKPTHLPTGRVLAVTGEGTRVAIGGQVVIASLRRSLYLQSMRVKNLVTVGDIVYLEGTAIAGVQERTSLLTRTDPRHSHRQHLLAANIDQVLITVSVDSPPLKPALIDRYIIATLSGNMTPIIVINKIDLPGQRDLLEECVELYRQIGYAVCPVSAKTGKGLDALKKAMHNQTSVFSGQSGVGKSALINASLGLERKIGEIVAKTRKGSHTTTTAELLPLEGGGWCIDSPGIKSFGLWDIQPRDVLQYFGEIDAAGRECRFPNCSHTHEPDCAVISAVERGEISELRYRSYCALLDDLVE